ncbi:hypothetical protein [Neorhizobium tunisiense]|uniref:hypothetical protein n=1 Tax=Neorhizobium tunisiense TaxID=3144793 RepID=UPI00404877DE
MGAGHQPFQLSVQGSDGLCVSERQRPDHLLILSQEQGKRSRPFQHRAQQRNLEIGIGAALVEERFHCGTAAVKTGGKKSGAQERGSGKGKDRPWCPREGGILDRFLSKALLKHRRMCA